MDRWINVFEQLLTRGIAPQQYPSSDHFPTYNDDANNMMSSLHLDTDDEPRSRALGASSRANSVRFDETANQNHFSSHSARPSFDYPSRQSSGYSGLQMAERTPSHKSEGRSTSVHSLRSLASGRTSSINLDDGTGDTSPMDTPGLSPGQKILGPAPAIIRCWAERIFKNENAYHVAVGSGSCRSWIDLRLIKKLGVEQAIVSHDDEGGLRTMMLRLYFVDGVHNIKDAPKRVHQGRNNDILMPSLELDFCVLENTSSDLANKAIQIYLGADILQDRQADILFSSQKFTILDNDDKRVSMPIRRPEDVASFNTLRLTGDPPPNVSPNTAEVSVPPPDTPYLNGLGRSSTVYTPSTTASPPPAAPPGLPTNAGKYRPPGALAAEHGSSDSTKQSAAGSDVETRPVSRQSASSRPSLSLLNTRHDEPSAQPGSQPSTVPASSSSERWGGWRRDAASTTPASAAANGGSMDFAAASKGRETSYARKETGMKVLKPKMANRTFSGSTSASTAIATPSTATASPSDGRTTSRFFPEARSRGDVDSEARSAQKENQGLLKASRTNPIGSASAFSWAK